MALFGHLIEWYEVMKMFLVKYSKVIVIVLCIVFLSNLLLFCNARFVPYTFKGSVAKGKPFYFEDTPGYWSELTDFAVCDGYLYVLYELKSVLCCYGLDGTYLHSYGLSMSKKGQAHLYVKDNTLYLESREHGFYTFEEGMFRGYFELNVTEYYSYKEELKASSAGYHESDGKQYVLKGASLWMVEGDHTQEIIHRPGWLTVFQGARQFIVHMLCLILLFAFVIYKRTRQ